MAKDPRPAPAGGENSEIQAFLRQVRAAPVPATGRRGRLLFALDATASRQPTWDVACQITGDMFAEAATLGGLDVQLTFYRGYGELKASAWHGSAADLIPIMSRVRCLGGRTQVERLLRHAVRQTRAERINALVFVGDCLEEDIDRVCVPAGELGLLGVPCFLFHEGDNPAARRGFAQSATLTRGACCRFDAGSPAELRQLLAAVAVYAAGGRQALVDYGRRKGGEVLRLSHQVG